MALFLTRVDAVPINHEKFSPEYEQWLTNLTDGLNSTIEQIQDNLSVVPLFTTAEITDLTAGSPNGRLFYDTTTDQLKAKVNGAIVVLA